MYKRPIFETIYQRMQEPRRFLQVLLGPRQIGKTTLALQVKDALKLESHYVSADTATLQDLAWLQIQWEMGRKIVREKGEGLLIIDEIQKISHWSEMIKKLWDEDSLNQLSLKVILLGSSPWLMQSGLKESLTGRFEILPIPHWSYQEMHQSFGWGVNQYLFFGGYPGPADLANEENLLRWVNYINDSLIETTISRDILLMTQVNKPILLRRLFQFACLYSSQILSYQKMVGQLQDFGNTTTLAHYLELLAGAGMVTGLDKYANQSHRARSSSPKLQVFNTALMSAQVGKTPEEAKEDSEYWGRLVESAVGAHLINGIRGTQMEVYYWREQNQEVDFVLKKGDALIAIEVKSSSKKERLSGLQAFDKNFHPKRLLLVGEGGVSLEEFLSTSVDKWF